MFTPSAHFNEEEKYKLSENDLFHFYCQIKGYEFIDRPPFPFFSEDVSLSEALERVSEAKAFIENFVLGINFDIGK